MVTKIAIIAGHDASNGHSISYLPSSHPGSYLGHHPGVFMSQDPGKSDPGMAVAIDLEVSAANGAGHHLDHQAFRLALRVLHLGELHVPKALKNCGFHNSLIIYRSLCPVQLIDEAGSLPSL